MQKFRDVSRHDIQCCRGSVDFVRSPLGLVDFSPWIFRLNSSHIGFQQSMRDGRPEGPCSSDTGDRFARNGPLNADDGPIQSWGGGAEYFVAFSHTSTSIDNGVRRRLCVGIDFDNVVVFFCKDGHDARLLHRLVADMVGTRPGGVLGRRTSIESLYQKGRGHPSMKPFQEGEIGCPPNNLDR